MIPVQAIEMNSFVAHAFNHCRRIVPGAVVDNDAFPILIGLCLQRCQRERQGVGGIEHGHQNGN